ncbi:MAG: NADH-quinone oxidoreductase subunit C [Candidatus Riflebacteria bacterium]|nr:NADH-quinone oxidoreductase subunit C [Candidatus Riflebacteria bacterium]
MLAQELFDHLKKRFPEQVLELSSGHAGDPFVTVAPAAVEEVCSFCRQDAALEFDQLMCLSGVDLPPDGMAVVYHLFSSTRKHKLVLKVLLSRADPRLPTVCHVWRTANWHERETYDLFGIVFNAHPCLRRLLLPPDWEGYPLRKDYLFPTEYRGIKCHD